jgi:nitrate reductase assembly molybdenum cofactor insertion protein NarJ
MDSSSIAGTTMTIPCIETPSPLLQEAASWRLLGLLFERPGPEWMEQVSTLANEVTEPTLKAAAEAARQEASPGLYHSTFGPGGPAAPREVSYRRGVLPGAALAELRSLYESFAYQPSVDEPPDHVAVEVGFMAYLRLKQAYALACGNDEHVRICAEAEQQFLHEHLSRMAAPLAVSLGSSGITYLAHAAQVLQSRVGPMPAEVALTVLPDEDPSEDE